MIKNKKLDQFQNNNNIVESRVDALQTAYTPAIIDLFSVMLSNPIDPDEASKNGLRKIAATGQKEPDKDKNRIEEYHRKNPGALYAHMGRYHG